MKIKFVMAMALVAGCVSYAQDTYTSWEGGTSDDWMTAGNWQNDIIPSGAEATARIWNSTSSTPSVPNNTVLYTGENASLKRVWIGRADAGYETWSGHLTVQSNASVTTSGDMNMDNNSTLVSSGAISVGGANGLLVRDSSSVTLKNGSTLNKLTLQNSSSGTLEAGSSVTTITPLSHSSQLTLNGSHTGNLTLNNDSSATINGTLDGNLVLASTKMAYVGASGTVDGDVEVSGGDQITFSGALQNGAFSVNQNGKAIIESTANIVSDSANSWLYNDADVTWNVGEDGSIGTLRTTRSESSAGANDGEWRYDGSTNLTVVLDAYDSGTHGTDLTLQLVSGIQQEAAFTNNVTFLLNGNAVDTFTYDGNGTFTGSVVPEPATIGMLGLGAMLGWIIRKFKTA